MDDKLCSCGGFFADEKTGIGPVGLLAIAECREK